MSFFICGGSNTHHLVKKPLVFTTVTKPVCMVGFFTPRFFSKFRMSIKLVLALSMYPRTITRFFALKFTQKNVVFHLWRLEHSPPREKTLSFHHSDKTSLYGGFFHAPFFLEISNVDKISFSTIHVSSYNNQVFCPKIHSKKCRFSFVAARTLTTS